MFNRKDPLVDSVKTVMEQNAIRRDVEKLVNEAFGVTSRKGLPHELHAAYDAALVEATEIALTEGMSKLNLNEVCKKKFDKAKVVVKEETETPKTTRINKSFEQFLRNKFSKE